MKKQNWERKHAHRQKKTVLFPWRRYLKKNQNQFEWSLPPARLLIKQKSNRETWGQKVTYLNSNQRNLSFQELWSKHSKKPLLIYLVKRLGHFLHEKRVEKTVARLFQIQLTFWRLVEGLLLARAKKAADPKIHKQLEQLQPWPSFKMKSVNITKVKR